MLLPAGDTAAGLLPTMLLEEHLLPVAELEVLITLLTADNLRRDDLLLAGPAGMAETWILIALLHIVNLGSDGKVKLRLTLYAGKLTMLELPAVLVTVGAADGLGKALLGENLLLAASEDKALPAVAAGNLLIVVQALRLLLGTLTSLLHGLGLLMLGDGLIVGCLLLLSGLLGDHARINGGDSLGKVRQSDPVGL